MGLIKSGIKYGALAFVAKQAINAVNEHSKGPGQGQGQQQQQQQFGNGFIQGGQSRDAQHLQYQQESSGYVHQSYCNGSCGQQCNPGYNGYAQQQQQPPAYRGSDQQMPRGQIDAAPPAYHFKTQDLKHI